MPSVFEGLGLSEIARACQAQGARGPGLGESPGPGAMFQELPEPESQAGLMPGGH